MCELTAFLQQEFNRCELDTQRMELFLYSAAHCWVVSQSKDDLSAALRNLCGLCVKDWLFTQSPPSLRKVAEKCSTNYDTTHY
jgi:hypothetical protein